MKAYSHDLRERVAAACAESGAKIYQVAARFSVSLSFTDKLLRRQRTSGSVAELPRHPGPAPRLDAAGDQRLLACLRAQPDATLAEIGQALVAAGGPSLQRTAVWQAVERLGWGRKKSVHAAERDTKRVVALRRLFVEAIQEEDVAHFVFVDETSTNLTYCRLTRRTLIRLNGPSASSKSGCAPRKYVPAMRSKKPCWPPPHG